MRKLFLDTGYLIALKASDDQHHQQALTYRQNLIDEPLFPEAWRSSIQHSDKSYSLTDCASFVVMKRLRIKTAPTFDQHFVQAGFDRKPESGSPVSA